MSYAPVDRRAYALALLRANAAERHRLADTMDYLVELSRDYGCTADEIAEAATAWWYK